MSSELVSFEDSVKSMAILSQDEIRQFIADVETELKKLPQSEIPLKHYFSNGVYAREIIVPTDMVIVGKIHKYESLNIVSKGEITVLSIDGMPALKPRARLFRNPNKASWVNPWRNRLGQPFTLPTK